MSARPNSTHLPADPPDVAPRQIALKRPRKRRPAVRARDIERAVQAVQNAGLAVSGVRIDADGGFTVLTGTPAAPVVTPLQQWQAKRAGRT
jgi:hypothetical protein